jgi:hypothetical protein
VRRRHFIVCRHAFSRRDMLREKIHSAIAQLGFELAPRRLQTKTRRMLRIDEPASCARFIASP